VVEDGVGQRVFREGLCTCCRRQHVGPPTHPDDFAHDGFTDSDGAGLVQHDVVDVGEDLEGVPERIRMPRLAALPPPRMSASGVAIPNAQGYPRTRTASAANAPRWTFGPPPHASGATSQKVNESAAIVSTPGTK